MRSMKGLQPQLKIMVPQVRDGPIIYDKICRRAHSGEFGGIQIDM